ncbi:MAG: MerR family transcriptional regulator [Tissierellia bacterium]|nr:MerR family transcriptional regulator [Tissierellia bacterium]
MNAKEVTKMTGVSVRTLHHYDQIGLLMPDRDPDNGYRVYSDEDLDRLQQILFFKACGFPLAQIKKLIDHPDFDRFEAFKMQKKALLHERNRIEGMIGLLERTMRSMRGGEILKREEKFEGFDFTSNPYEEEARMRWGDQGINQANEYLERIGDEGKRELGNQMNEIFRMLSAVRHEDPASDAAQNAVKKLYVFFNQDFGNGYSHGYTPESFGNLGQMYVDDPRFTESIDRFGEGLASFLAKAMGIFAANHRKV